MFELGDDNNSFSFPSQDYPAQTITSGTIPSGTITSGKVASGKVALGSSVGNSYPSHNAHNKGVAAAAPGRRQPVIAHPHGRTKFDHQQLENQPIDNQSLDFQLDVSNRELGRDEHSNQEHGRYFSQRSAQDGRNTGRHTHQSDNLRRDNMRDNNSRTDSGKPNPKRGFFSRLFNIENFPFLVSTKGIMQNWLGLDLAMDLGTANTLIYMRGHGIVLNEPSVVAVREEDSQMVAIGREAKEMYGKTSKNVRCIRPLKDGVIADFSMTHLMIKHFLHSATCRWQLRRPRLIVSVPSGITMVEKRAVIDAALSSGARQIHLIEEPMAAAIGSGLDVNSSRGCMIVDIGGGTTEVAVISMGSTAYSESVRIAGDEMDEAIEHFVRKAFNLQIGIFEAERVKIAIGSAMPMTQSRELKIYGRDLSTGVPRELILDDAVIREALREPVQAIIEAVFRALERTSPELAEDIIKNGIYIAGGGSLLAGLPERLSIETGLKFYRHPDPLTAIVRGTGKVLDSFKTMQGVCIA